MPSSSSITPVSPPVFEHRVGDIITFQHHMARPGCLTTGYIYKVLYPRADDITYYFYCDVEHVGVYGMLSSLHTAAPAAPHVLHRMERWWETKDLPPSPPPRPTSERHFHAGDFIAVRCFVPGKPHDTLEFVTAYIYRVEHRSKDDECDYWYCDVHRPGVYGRTSTKHVVCPPHLIDTFGLERWWDDAEFKPHFLAQKDSFSPKTQLICEPTSPSTAYSPVDWENDPIYLAAKAKQVPAFLDFEPETKPPSKKAKTAEKKAKPAAASPFDEYHGWSPDGGCSHLRWGSPAPPRGARRGKKKAGKAKKDIIDAPPMPELPSSAVEPSKARATTEEELVCHEDMAACMAPPA